MQLEFLGHHVNAQGIRPLEHTVQIIREFPQPMSQRQLRKEFLRLVNFYGRCCKKNSIDWTDDTTTAFNSTKDMLAQATLLVHPKPDAPTNIMTDASEMALGVVLEQYISGEWQSIAYFFKKAEAIGDSILRLRQRSPCSLPGHQALPSFSGRPPISGSD